MTSASACGKAILLGEHAVVYGQPALAIPLPTLRAFARVEPSVNSSGILIHARDLGKEIHYTGSIDDEGDLGVLALRTTVHNTLEAVSVCGIPALHITLHSELPVARGLGSGTAISIALIRALAEYLGSSLDEATVSELAYRTEALYHGHPSGIDNTVIAFERPVLFQRGQLLPLLTQFPSFTLLVADSGIPSQTRSAVEQVRQVWQENPEQYNTLFEEIGTLVAGGCAALERGDWHVLGDTMNANQALLRKLGVSTPELEHLITAALKAGALGAKLSGGGLGGCIIALVEDNQVEAISQALAKAGALKVWDVEVHDAHRD